MLHTRKTLWGPTLCLLAQGSQAAPLAQAMTSTEAEVHPERVLVILADPLRRTVQALGHASNTVSGSQVLQQGAQTLGDALGQQAGIQAGSFGAGASRPVIRGQEGARVQVVQEGSALLDASGISPDHAIAVDPQLVRRLEVLRGPATLRYGGGAIGGVVHVVDRRMDETMPEGGQAGQFSLRTDSNGRGWVASAGVSQALSGAVVLRLEGLRSEQDPYRVPRQGQDRHVEGTQSDQQTGTVGLSWVDAQGFAGLAYTRQQRQYGLPGHDHSHEHCALQGETLACEAEPEGEPDHGALPPQVDLISQRWELRADRQAPWRGVAQLSFRGNYTDYQHQELEEGVVGTTFANRGHDARLELTLQPWAGWRSVVGVQTSQSRLSALGDEALMPVTDTQTHSLFWLGHRPLSTRWHVEGGLRGEWQRIQPQSPQPQFQGHAWSASLGSGWQLSPHDQLSLTLSRSQRLPNAQERYAHGLHLASNTFELGDPALLPETVNGLELGLRRTTGAWRYTFSVFGQRAQDYVYARTLDQHEGLRLIRYSQSGARFRGGELEIGHPINARGRWTLWADTVRSSLQGGGVLPRQPADRLGLRLDQRLWGSWTGELEWLHAFAQKNTADFESPTPAHDLLNATLRHQGVLKSSNTDYSLFVTGKNLLNQTVVQHTSFLASRVPDPGRAFSVGVQLNF